MRQMRLLPRENYTRNLHKKLTSNWTTDHMGSPTQIGINMEPPTTSQSPDTTDDHLTGPTNSTFPGLRHRNMKNTTSSGILHHFIANYNIPKYRISVHGCTTLLFSRSSNILRRLGQFDRRNTLKLKG